VRIDYLVGGLRISLGADSKTPGPANHIENSISAFRALGHDVAIYMSSDQPALQRFASVAEGAHNRASASPIVTDLVRLGASTLNLARVAVWSARSDAELVYERAAVMTNLSAFHGRVVSSRAIQIIESNGIFSRETARDRHALKAESLARRIERNLYRKADLVVAVSESLAAELCTYAAIPVERILVVPNGVPPGIRGSLKSGARRNVIGFAGAVVEWQNLAALIRAFARVRSFVPVSGEGHWQVHIVGDGPALIELQGTAKAMGVTDCVHFFPRMSRSSLYETMTAWRVGIALHKPSSSATMYHSPLKLYEYAGLGLSCLATDSPDAVGLRRSGAAITTVPPTEDGIADGLLRVLQMPLCDEYEIQKRGEAVLSSHNWESRMESVMARVRELRAGQC